MLQLRLLKTILNELVKLKGQGIRLHLSLVPVESKPTLCSYIELVLQQHVSARTQVHRLSLSLSLSFSLSQRAAAPPTQSSRKNKSKSYRTPR